jgi:hypothetical protein
MYNNTFRVQTAKDRMAQDFIFLSVKMANFLLRHIFEKADGELGVSQAAKMANAYFD